MDQATRDPGRSSWASPAFIDLGTRVLVLGHFHVIGRDGIEVERPFANLWTLRDGLAVRMDESYSINRALEAAGLFGVSDVEAFGDRREHLSRRPIRGRSSIWSMRASRSTTRHIRSPTCPVSIKGKDSAVDRWRDYWGTWDEYTVEPSRSSMRRRACSHRPARARTREGSGAPFEFHSAVVHTFRCGKLARVEFHGTREQALEAVGLSEQDAHADSSRLRGRHLLERFRRAPRQSAFPFLLSGAKGGSDQRHRESATAARLARSTFCRFGVFLAGSTPAEAHRRDRLGHRTDTASA